MALNSNTKDWQMRIKKMQAKEKERKQLKAEMKKYIEESNKTIKRYEELNAIPVGRLAFESVESYRKEENRRRKEAKEQINDYKARIQEKIKRYKAEEKELATYNKEEKEKIKRYKAETKAHKKK